MFGFSVILPYCKRGQLTRSQYSAVVIIAPLLTIGWLFLIHNTHQYSRSQYLHSQPYKYKCRIQPVYCCKWHQGDNHWRLHTHFCLWEQNKKWPRRINIRAWSHMPQSLQKMFPLSKALATAWFCSKHDFHPRCLCAYLHTNVARKLAVCNIPLE